VYPGAIVRARLPVFVKCIPALLFNHITQELQLDWIVKYVSIRRVQESEDVFQGPKVHAVEGQHAPVWFRYRKKG